MNLSSFVYDLFDELKNLQKGNLENDTQSISHVFHLIQAHEKTFAILSTQTEKLRLYEKELRTEKDKLTAEIMRLDSEKENKKEICKEITKNIGGLKDIEKRITNEDEIKRLEITKKYEDSLAEICKAYAKYDTSDLDAMKLENDKLKGDMNQQIEMFKEKEQNYQSTLKQLQEQFNQIQSSLTKRYEDLQKQIQELEEMKASRDAKRNSADTIRQKISIYHEKVPSFHQMIEYKDTQYKRYVVEIKEIIDRYYEQYREKQKYDSMAKEMSETYLAIHLEVE